MVYAERGNRVKTISEDDIQKYVEQGYIITDGMGTVLKDTVPTDIVLLKKAYTQHKEQIASLQAEVDRLTARLKEAESAKPVKVVTADDAPKAKADEEVKETVQETATTTKRTRKSNKAE